MHTILVVVHLFLSIGLIGLILIQHGKGADAGAAFGSGASSTVFGARGSANFLSRTTGVLALLFFVTSLALAWMAMQTARDAGLMIDVQTTETQPIPAAESDLPAIPAAADTSEVPMVPVSAEPVEAPAEPKSE
ncbi:MAG TPA: preprotein translocase subunit SecG [Thiolapillus brandeum]|uniref:Protein-export membrane protein SecG n=1 Tax=Thiolapillus brandeum TaxID=1076588 RepID=A0A831K4M3_9GAMM|nr:preprotein translocase subunit SecG [Thiolapillus brandeum]